MLAKELITSPVEYPITLSEAKEHLRVTFPDDDTYISFLIRVAVDTIESFTSKKLITQTWNYYLDTFPDYEISLPFSPVQSVTFIKYYNTDNVLTTLDTASYQLNKYVLYPSIKCADLNTYFPQTMPGKYNSVQIQLVCGYGDASKVPDAIKQALKISVADMYLKRTSEYISNKTFERLLNPFRIINLA